MIKISILAIIKTVKYIVFLAFLVSACLFIFNLDKKVSALNFKVITINAQFVNLDKQLKEATKEAQVVKPTPIIKKLVK